MQRFDTVKRFALYRAIHAVNRNGKHHKSAYSLKTCEKALKTACTMKNDTDIISSLQAVKRAISIGFEKTFGYSVNRTRNGHQEPQPDTIRHQQTLLFEAETEPGRTDKRKADRRSDPQQAKEKDRRSGPIWLLKFFHPIPTPGTEHQEAKK